MGFLTNMEQEDGRQDGSEVAAKSTIFKAEVKREDIELGGMSMAQRSARVAAAIFGTCGFGENAEDSSVSCQGSCS